MSMDAIYEKLLVKERKSAFIKAVLINFCLSAYFFASLLYCFEINSYQSVSGVYYSISVLFSLGFAIVWSRSDRSAGRTLVERSNKALKNLRPIYKTPWLRTFSGLFTLSVALITAWMGWQLTDVSLYALFSYDGAMGAKRIFSALLNPNFSIIDNVLAAMLETIFIALMATLLAIPIAFVGSFFAARNLMKGSMMSFAVYNVLRFLFNFCRSVEPIIWAIVFSVWVGIGPFAGMLALMLHSIASLIKLYSEQIENIDRGPVEAIEATGANPIQVVWYGVVPQIVLPYLSFTIYRWDINVRMATIIGLVGGGGVGTLLMQYQGLARWNEVGTIVIVIAAVVWLMDYLSAKIREAIY